MSIDDVMARLAICRKAVMRLIRTGQLSAYKVGQQWRFEAKDVDTYLRSVKFQPRTVAPARLRARAHQPKQTSAGAARYM